MINYHEFHNDTNSFVPIEETETISTEEETFIETESTEELSNEISSEDFLAEATVGESRCYLRVEASKESKDLTILEPGDELLVDFTESTDEWYKVCTASGVDGYVMKRLVKLS